MLQELAALIPPAASKPGDVVGREIWEAVPLLTRSQGQGASARSTWQG